MAYIVIAYVVMAYVVMAYIVMAGIVTAYIVMAYIVMAYIVNAYTVHHRFQPQLQCAAAVRRGKLFRAADLFLATFRRMPRANAGGLDRVGGWRRKGLGETRL